MRHRASRQLLLFAAACAFAVVAGCAPSAQTSAGEQPVRVTVSAATSLKRALQEMEPLFEAENPDVDLVFNFAPSGVLARQIEQGAPVDVFVSAGPREVDSLIEAGVVAADATRTVGGNELGIIVAAQGGAPVFTVADLARARRVALGDPGTTPVGAKAKEWLTNVGVWDEVADGVVFAGNVTQVLDYVARGEVDAGVVFASEAVGRDDVTLVSTASAGELLTPIRYVGAPVSRSRHADVAVRFLDALVSEKGRAVLRRWGFTEPAATEAAGAR